MSFSYKSSISFGLVYIPIRLHNIIKADEIGFNMLDKKTNSRIAYKKVSTASGEEVKQEDIVKGYQYEKDKYVIFEEDDFEKIKSPKDKSITIDSFVDISEIDPIYYDKSYFILPDGAEKAFMLLKVAMEKKGKIGIAKTMLGTKECMIALRINNGEMILNTLYFFSEVQKNPIKDTKLVPAVKEIKLAEMIIDNMEGTFRAEEYSDEYNVRLQKAIEEKIKGEQITISSDDDSPNPAIDLMEALEKTLNSRNQKTARANK